VEGQGLLPLPARNEMGYRVYSDEARRRLRFIAKAKAVNLSSEEIREVLNLLQAGICPCEYVRIVIDRKRAERDELLSLLAGFRQELLRIRSEADEATIGDAYVCGIIEQHQ
jgi:DNA-binding transcriptional MerR regulator